MIIYVDRKNVNMEKLRLFEFYLSRKSFGFRLLHLQTKLRKRVLNYSMMTIKTLVIIFMN